VAKLVAKSPGEDVLPITIGPTCLSENLSHTITCVAPFKGQEQAVSATLTALVGTGLPGIGRMNHKADVRVAWSGLGQYFVFSPHKIGRDQVPGALISDQSDAWACLTLDGASAQDVLARLTPIDVRDNSFKKGHVASSILGHISALFLRSGANRYDILVFRSMVQTATHEIMQAI